MWLGSPCSVLDLYSLVFKLTILFWFSVWDPHVPSWLFYLKMHIFLTTDAPCGVSTIIVPKLFTKSRGNHDKTSEFCMEPLWRCERGHVSMCTTHNILLGKRELWRWREYNRVSMYTAPPRWLRRCTDYLSSNTPPSQLYFLQDKH